MTSTIMLIPLLVTLAQHDATAGVSLCNSINQNPQIQYVAEKKDDCDPGKDATDDPHGGNPHGANPHGRDPYDEIHDKSMPANNTDPYGNKR